jgi:hypothetical protein
MAEFTVYVRDKNDKPLALHDIFADSLEDAGPAAIAWAQEALGYDPSDSWIVVQVVRTDA